MRINAQIKDLNSYITLTWLTTAFVSFGCTTPISAGTEAAEMAGASGGAPVSPFAGQTTGGQTTAGQTTAGQTTAGQMTAGQTTAGQMTAGVMSAGDSDPAGDVVTPMCEPELCDGMDNDCDGEIDEMIPCPCSEDTSCYGGPPATRGLGVCQDGARMCDPSGEYWLACMGWSGPEGEEVCDERDNDCDGDTDEGLINSCGVCGEPDPEEVCDGMDNDCDGDTDEGLLNSCGECGDDPEEVCDGMDNDCDGDTDEGLLNTCGECGDEPQEICDTRDNDCDGAVDEDVCLDLDLDLDGDCLTVTCPPEAPYPVACDIDFQGGDPRGCVAYNPPDSSVYLQEGNQCGAGRLIGTLTCSTIPGGRLNERTCAINKPEKSYPLTSDGCAETE